MKWTIILCSIGLVISIGRDTRACGEAPYPVSPQHTTDPAEKEIDHQAPGVAQITGVEVTRGEPTPSNACGAVACPSIGGISVEIVPAVDDRTDASRMGYLVTVEGGVSLLQDSQTPLRAVENRINASFIDDPERDLALTVSVRAVDLGGNVGEPSNVFRVVVQGEPSGGCATAGGQESFLLLAGLAVFLRRR